MPNPWLQIPLADYEGHMSSPEVLQLETLATLFEDALNFRQPASVAIVGIAGGNGLRRINTRTTHRIVGVDINPQYLDAVRSRFCNLPQLELHCLDLSEQRLAVEPVELVHAALVFEHTGLDRCLDNVLSLVGGGGACSVVLQLPSDVAQGVGGSGIESVQKLAANFCLIPPAKFRELLEARGFALSFEKQISLPAGKSFWMGVFVQHN